MGTADLKAKFKSRRHEINVSTYQMCVLLLFNTEDTLSYSQISDTTAIPVADLKRALQSLACAKFKILRKDPVGRDVDDTDSFAFNEDFSAKQLRFKVGPAPCRTLEEAPRSRGRWAHLASTLALLPGGYGLCGEGERGGEAGNAAEGRRGPQAADRGGHCAHRSSSRGRPGPCRPWPRRPWPRRP